MKRLAIVVGHNSEKQGAVRGDTGETEFVWNSRLARMIKDAAPEYGIEVRTFFRVPGLGYRREIERVYNETDRWNAEATIELHFNGAESPDATGTETLSSGTALSLRLAESVQREMVATLGLRDRGIKTRAAKERGGGSLHAGRAPAILIEPFFGSSPRGQRATDDRSEQERLADAILRGAAEAMGAFPRADLSESRTLAATQTQRAANRGGVAADVLAACSTAAMAAKTEIEQIPAVGGLAEYLPYIIVGLIAVSFVAKVVANAMANKIDEARIDDADRGVR